MAKPGKNKNMWASLFRASEELQILQEEKTEDCTMLHATFAQIRILTYIRFSPGESMKIKEIADELHITSAAASQIVERMVQRGMVERKSAPGDRRSVCVTLSPEGHACWEQYDAISEAVMRQLLHAVPNGKLAVFQEVLDTLLAAVGEERKRLNAERS